MFKMEFFNYPPTNSSGVFVVGHLPLIFQNACPPDGNVNPILIVPSSSGTASTLIPAQLYNSQLGLQLSTILSSPLPSSAQIIPLIGIGGHTGTLQVDVSGAALVIFDSFNQVGIFQVEVLGNVTWNTVPQSTLQGSTRYIPIWTMDANNSISVTIMTDDGSNATANVTADFVPLVPLSLSSNSTHEMNDGKKREWGPSGFFVKTKDYGYKVIISKNADDALHLLLLDYYHSNPYGFSNLYDCSNTSTCTIPWSSIMPQVPETEYPMGETIFVDASPSPVAYNVTVLSGLNACVPLPKDDMCWTDNPHLQYFFFSDADRINHNNVTEALYQSYLKDFPNATIECQAALKAQACTTHLAVCGPQGPPSINARMTSRLNGQKDQAPAIYCQQTASLCGRAQTSQDCLSPFMLGVDEAANNYTTDYFVVATSTSISSSVATSMSTGPSTSPMGELSSSKTQSDLTTSDIIAGSSSKTGLPWLYIGIGIGGAILMLIMMTIIVVVIILKRKTSTKSNAIELSLTSEAYVDIAYVGSSVPEQRRDAKTFVIDYQELVLDNVLGSGFFGEVYRGQWRSSTVAVKMIKSEKVSEKALNELLAEAEFMQEMQPHRNVVTFLGVCQDPLCIVTEFLENGSLDSLWKRMETPWKMKLQMIRDIAAGMLHLSLEKIIHKDLAARNILIGRDFEAKVADFGLSIVSSEVDSVYLKSEVGPIKWMAPESLLKRKWSSKSDVWSFGITVLEILNQRVPYHHYTNAKAIELIFNQQLNPEEDFPDDLPPDLKFMLQQCFIIEPNGRITFQEVCSVLNRIVQSQ
eukprot:TRINITY_DN9140_c1_g1_i1.p1 TRINITY_DN9140_c1_g1~~TRINITY_DN9140_c1_g1_i1.p1  ORF type:complete len:808 (-),score=157.86 TRINITY_DN9140_c1_g1_i1:51-2474(-)